LKNKQTNFQVEVDLLDQLGFKPKTTSTFNRGAPVKPSFAPKSPSPITNDFERRKLAEQRATKRLKGR